MIINPLDWIYDLESYPNVFTGSFKHVATGSRMKFEISTWKNDLDALIAFLYALKQTNCRCVGFNNIGYDYPVIHFIIENYQFSLDADDIYQKSAGIISTPWMNRFSNVIWDKDTHIQQIDLFKIHHFDNDARRTSLKMLEFNMCSDNIKDLPFEPDFPLWENQVETLIKYNDHDVDETEKFYLRSLEMIKFREELSEKHKRNFLNFSDKKIGTDLFITELEENTPGSCYSYETGTKQTRQTIRTYIKLKDIIFPYIKFKNLEFEKAKQWFLARTVTPEQIKGGEKYTVTINDFNYDLRLGGIHGSVDSTIVCSDDDYIITDWDVGGFYPEVGTANKLYPEHLSEQFCVVNENLKQERKKYDKGTPLNLAIKLARNGAYGDSNMKYSPFYDPQYTMSITVNGQLLLCMLAQYLIEIPGLQMIQINTDGLTVRCPKQHVEAMNKICKWWEQYTCLELEKANYKRMFIRDVNNYIGEYEDGKLKRKGAYIHETPLENPNTQEVLWHKNHSALVVPKAAEAALVYGQCVDDFIMNHTNIMDFMLRTKVGRSDQLLISHPVHGEQQIQRITRYYISKTGETLTKVSPPANSHKVGSWKRATKLTDEYYNSVIDELRLNMQAKPPSIQLDIDSIGLPWDERINTKNRSKYIICRTGVDVGWFVTVCNDIKDAKRNNINYDYYIAKANKLVDPLRGN